MELITTLRMLKIEFIKRAREVGGSEASKAVEEAIEAFDTLRRKIETTQLDEKRYMTDLDKEFYKRYNWMRAVPGATKFEGYTRSLGNIKGWIDANYVARDSKNSA